MDMIATENGGVYVDLGELPSPEKQLQQDSPGNFIDLIQLEAELSQEDVALQDRSASRMDSSVRGVKCKTEAATLAEMREELRAQAELVRASRSTGTLPEVSNRSNRGNDGNTFLGHRPPRYTTSLQQPGSACSEPFPEPVGDMAPTQPQSVFTDGHFALCPELPPSPLSPPGGMKAAATKTLTNSDFAQVAHAAIDDESATIRAAFSMVRAQIDAFKRRGRSQLCTLEEDLQALLHQQEEVENLAANVSTLVLAESSTRSSAVRVG